MKRSVKMRLNRCVAWVSVVLIVMSLFPSDGFITARAASNPTQDTTVVDQIAPESLEALATESPELSQEGLLEEDFESDDYLTWDVWDPSAFSTFSMGDEKVVDSVTVNVEWVNDTILARPERLEVQLYRNAQSYGRAVSVSSDANWTYTWEDLPLGYSWNVMRVGVSPAGYSCTTMYETSVNDDGSTTTNCTIVCTWTGDVTLTDIQVNVVWQGEPNTDLRPKSMSFNTWGNRIDVKAKDGWTAQLKDLPNRAYSLSLIDEPPVGYVTTIDSNSRVSFGKEYLTFTVTNIYTGDPPNTVDVTVNVVWEGDEEDTYWRPNNLYVGLLRSGIPETQYGVQFIREASAYLTEDGGWTHTWYDQEDRGLLTVDLLTGYDHVSEYDNDEFYSPNGYISTLTSDYDLMEGTITFTLTETYVGAIKPITYEVNSTWLNDTSSTRPKQMSYSFRWWDNSRYYESNSSYSSGGTTLYLKDSCDWKMQWRPSTQREMEYFISPQSPPEGYMTEMTTSWRESEHDRVCVYDFVYTWVSPELPKAFDNSLVNVYCKILWDDNDNAAGIRPDTVETCIGYNGISKLTAAVKKSGYSAIGLGKDFKTVLKAGYDWKAWLPTVPEGYIVKSSTISTGNVSTSSGVVECRIFLITLESSLNATELQCHKLQVVWENDDSSVRPDSVQITMLRNSSTYSCSPKAGEGWLINLPMQYMWTPLRWTNPVGYTSRLDYDVGTRTYTITFTFYKPVVHFTTCVMWADPSETDPLPDLNVRLTGDGSEYGYTGSGYDTLSAENVWTLDWENLDASKAWGLHIINSLDWYIVHDRIYRVDSDRENVMEVRYDIVLEHAPIPLNKADIRVRWKNVPPTVEYGSDLKVCVLQGATGTTRFLELGDEVDYYCADAPVSAGYHTLSVASHDQLDSVFKQRLKLDCSWDGNNRDVSMCIDYVYAKPKYTMDIFVNAIVDTPEDTDLMDINSIYLGLYYGECFEDSVVLSDACNWNHYYRNLDPRRAYYVDVAGDCLPDGYDYEMICDNEVDHSLGKITKHYTMRLFPSDRTAYYGGPRTAVTVLVRWFDEDETASRPSELEFKYFYVNGLEDAMKYGYAASYTGWMNTTSFSGIVDLSCALEGLPPRGYDVEVLKTSRMDESGEYPKQIVEFIFNLTYVGPVPGIILDVTDVYSNGYFYDVPEKDTIYLLCDGAVYRTADVYPYAGINNRVFENLDSRHSWTVAKKQDASAYTSTVSTDFDVDEDGLTLMAVSEISNVRARAVPAVTDIIVAHDYLNQDVRDNPDLEFAPVDFVLKCDGEAFDTVTLSEENNWEHKWEDMEGEHLWTVERTSELTDSYSEENAQVVSRAWSLSKDDLSHGYVLGYSLATSDSTKNSYSDTIGARTIWFCDEEERSVEIAGIAVENDYYFDFIMNEENNWRYVLYGIRRMYGSWVNELAPAGYLTQNVHNGDMMVAAIMPMLIEERLFELPNTGSFERRNMLLVGTLMLTSSGLVALDAKRRRKQNCAN